MIQVFQPGERIADRFDVVRLIAEGGMGQVYEARDDTLGGRVALKALHHLNAEDPTVRQRFRREIQLARQVTHPNVCRIYDVYQHRFPEGDRRSGLDVTLVTMELLDGETLESYLEARGPMREAEALPIVRQIAAGLDAAHGVGVVHRDLKPGNVILVPSDGGSDDGALRAVVTDFGLARSMSPAPSMSTTPLTGEMKVVGTVDYIAPEQLRDEPVSPASDLYALGVVIFEMVTGKRPYEAPNALTLLTRRATEAPSSPLLFKPDLEPRWSSVILRCLEDKPQSRPSSAGEVSRMLSSADPPPAKRSAVSRRRGVAALASSAVLLGVLLVVILALRHEPRPTRWAQPAQLTTSAGLELDPAFSPDGNKLAYSSDETGSFEIFVRDLGPGGRTSQLTDDGGRNVEPVFSPDGRRLAYHSVDSGGIWEIPLGGGEPRQLSENGSRPAYSPDGRLLAFQSDSAPLVSDNSVPARDTTTLQILDLESGARRQLTQSGQPAGGHGAPAFSPDGWRIAFSASARNTSEIWTVGLDGSSPTFVVGGENQAYEPVFDHGGRRLYFTGYARQVFALWVIELTRDGRPRGEPVQVRNLGLASLRTAALSSDGVKLAYTALYTRSNLWSLRIDPDGVPQEAPRSLTSGTSRHTRPAFSPDGSRIAWEHWTRGGNVDAWTMRSDGEEATKVTTSPENDLQPTWLDDRRLVFLRRDEGIYRLYVSDLETGREEELTSIAEDSDWARLSPDGTRVAYHSKSGGVTVATFVRDLSNGHTELIGRGSELMGYPCWSPDGRWIVFQARMGESHQIMLAPSDGSREPSMVTDAPAVHYPYSFSPDNEKIAFAANRGGRWNLWWVTPATGEELPLSDFDLPGGYVRYPTWSPKGDQIVFERAESTGDVWISDGAKP